MSRSDGMKKGMKKEADREYIKFLLCVLRKENIGEVSRSDGGVENLSGSVFLNPLACGAPLPLWRTQGESLNVTPWHLQEAQKRKPFVTACGTPLYFLAEYTGGEVNFPLHHPHRNYSGLNFLIIILSCKFVKM